MNLEAFFEKFDLFADCPNAVQKMRELILHLAVNGKLLIQDTDTEQLSGKYLAEEISDKIPLNWRQTEFGKYCDIQGGGQPPKSQFLFEPREGYVRLFQIRDLGDSPAPTYVPLAGVTKFCKTGDILIGRYGASVGKIFWAENGTYNVALAKFLYPEDLFVPGFAFLLLKSPCFQLPILDISRSAQAGFNKGDLSKICLPLPPLAEQKRIVSKVDELMALCDTLEAQQKEREAKRTQLAKASLTAFAEAPSPTSLELLFHPSFAIDPADLRKSILTLAVQGKLVAQTPIAESAEENLCRVEASSFKTSDDDDGPITDAEIPWSLPFGWKWMRFGCVANIKHGYAFSSESFTSEPTPYVLTTPGNFFESGGFRDRGTNTKYFNGEVPSTFVFNAGDLIIPMTEQAAGLLGSPAFIPDDGKSYLHNQRLGKLEFYSNEISPEFVYWFFNSDFFRSELARTCTGMKVRHTSPKRILKVPFPLPPLVEQKRIVAKVDELMAMVDQLEAKIVASREAASRLLDAMVAELSGKAA